MKPVRISHHYVDELELKSLLIRLKNTRVLQDYDGEDTRELMKEDEIQQALNIKNGNYNQKLNSFINNDIKRFVNIKRDLKRIDEEATSFNQAERIRNIQRVLKDRVIKNSEITMADKVAHERFGKIVILMVKNIIRKPNFAMLEYHEDFYSDASHKIFRYMKNFDHTKISDRSGYQVNAFAYISQIIHNSIIFIINQRKRESDKINEYTKDNLGSVDFLTECSDDYDIFSVLSNICPLDFPYEIKDQYPFVIKDLLNFIESNYSVNSEETMIERIMDYQETSNLGPTLVGDAIRSDEYLVRFVERYQKPDTTEKDW